MEHWIALLREQTAKIAGGDYQPVHDGFSSAPAEIAALSRDLDALAKAMAERDAVQKALTLEVHHRVKNNLQIVSSLLNMQASKLQDPAAWEALRQTRARVGALALIHRMLYEQDGDGGEGRINIARLIAELCAQFRLWYRDRDNIAFSCQASAFAVPLDSAMPLALLAVEAVTNAYAHAFPGGRSGSIALHLSATENGDALLSVTDNGVGFDVGGSGKSMGRQLMNAFAFQLGGTLDITSGDGNGTEVRLAYRIGT